jgi:hypothetical protein
MISGFHHKLDEICALLGYYTVYSGNSLPMFRDYLPVPSLMVKQIKTWISGHWKMGPAGCSETMVRNYHYMLCNISEKRRSHILTEVLTGNFLFLFLYLVCTTNQRCIPSGYILQLWSL